MVSEVAENAGSGTEITLSGKSYYISPLDPYDLGELEVWMQDIPFVRMKAKLDILGDQVTESIRKQLLETAEQESLQLRIEHEVASRLIHSIEGTARLLWLSLRKRQPALTYDEVVPLLTLDNLQSVQAKLDEVSGLVKKERLSPMRPRRQIKKKPGRNKKG